MNRFIKKLNLSEKNLYEKIKKKEFTVGVIGLGYVGLPLSKTITHNQIKVIGFDIDRKLIKQLKSGKSPFRQIKNQEIKEMSKLFLPTTDFRLISSCDLIILCLPTPISKNQTPDLSYITNTLETIKSYLKKFQTISLESTTWPGTTNEILKPFLEKIGFSIGKNFYLIYSPEREDPGNKSFENFQIPKLLSGTTEKCFFFGHKYYKHFFDSIIKAKSTKAAELTKLYENIYRSVNIGLVNELKIISDKMDIDIFEVIRLASTKPFGFKAFHPGPGVGGHCIPVDPHYLSWKAKEYDLQTKFIDIAAEINNYMPDYVVNKIIETLNIKKILIQKSKVLLLGMSYKKDSDDIRESPSIKILSLLKNKNVNVSYHDPYVNEVKKLRKYDIRAKSIDINQINLKKQDLVVLLTNHSSFDYDFILKYSKIIIDTKGVFKKSSKIYYA